MDRKERRQVNLYLNSREPVDMASNVVSGRMGKRNRDTGRVNTELLDGGLVPTRFIGNGGRQQGSTTQLDLDGWGDS